MSHLCVIRITELISFQFISYNNHVVQLMGMHDQELLADGKT